MPQSSTLDVGLDVHQESIAMADSAQEHGAEVTSLGPIDTRPWDMDHLIRKRPSKVTPLVIVDEAGPCGDWLSRYRTKQAITAGWWRPPAGRTRPATASKPPAVTRGHGPTCGAPVLSPRSIFPRRRCSPAGSQPGA
jgi:hypothetical protein